MFYEESAKLAIEQVIENGILSKRQYTPVFNILKESIDSWRRGYKRSHFYKEGRSLGAYLDFRINRAIYDYSFEHNSGWQVPSGDTSGYSLAKGNKNVIEDPNINII